MSFRTFCGPNRPLCAPTLLVGLLAILAPAGLAQSAPVIVSLGNTQVRYDFDATNGTLVQVNDLPNAKSIAIQNDKPWRIQLYRVGSNPTVSVLAEPAGGPTSTAAGATTLRFVWQQSVDNANTIVVAQLFDLPAGQNHLRSRLEVYGDGGAHYGLPANQGTTNLAIHETRTYLTVAQQLTGSRIEDFALLSARGAWGVHSPAAVLKPPFTVLGQPGHDRLGSMSWDPVDGLREDFNYNLFLGCYWYNDGSGVYAHPERGNGFHPLFTGYRSLSGNRFQMAHVEKHARDNVSGMNALDVVALRIAPYRTSRTITGWYEFAQLYRAYLQSTGFFSRGIVSQRSDLGSTLRDGTYLQGWFGVDADPSAYPYQNAAWRAQAIGVWDRSRAFVGAKEMGIFFFIGWNQYVNFAHSDLVPKPGQGQFFSDIHANGKLRPMVYTLTNYLNYAPMDSQYPTYGALASRDIHGNLHRAVNWGPYGTVDSINPATGAWAAAVDPRLGALASGYGVGGCYFDSPAPMPADYNNVPTNLPGPGDYQIQGSVNSLAYLRNQRKQTDPGYITITENAPEAFMHDMDLLGADGLIPYLVPTIFDYVPPNNRLDLYLGGYEDLQSVQFNAAVYHHSVPVVGVQPILPSEVVSTAYWNNYFFHLGRAALEAGGIPTMLEIGPVFGVQGLANHELPNAAPSTPGYSVFKVQGPRFANLVKDLLAYRANSPYLVDGEWWPRPAYNTAHQAVSLPIQSYNGGLVQTSYNRPDVVSATWRATRPTMTNWFGLFFLTVESTSRTVGFQFNALQHGYTGNHTVKLYRNVYGVRTLVATGTNVVSFSTALTVDKVTHFEVEVL